MTSNERMGLIKALVGYTRRMRQSPVLYGEAMRLLQDSTDEKPARRSYATLEF